MEQDFKELKRLMVEGGIDGNDLIHRYDVYSQIDAEAALEQTLERGLSSSPAKGSDESPRNLTHYKNAKLGSFTHFTAKLGSFTHYTAKLGSFTHYTAKLGSFTYYQLGSFRHWLAAAAAVAVLVVGGLYWYWQEMRVIPPVISEQVLAAMEQSKQAGRQEAIIESLEAPLSSPKGGTTAPAHVTNEAPSGAVGGAVAALGEADCVTTRSDKEYWLTLSDGTLVHLNYNTRVIFPEKFVGDSRDVYLEGEAYFMVAKDRRHPFIVHTEQGDVKVYGTEFNVSTRGGESGKWKEESGKWKEESGKWKEESGKWKEAYCTEVVLVSGSVGVTPTGGSELMMKPGQKCSMFNVQCSMEDVDVTPYVAWNSGTLKFRYVPLEKVTDVLSKWYGVDFSFATPDIGKTLIVGDFDRYENLDNILSSISKTTGLTITREGSHIRLN